MAPGGEGGAGAGREGHDQHHGEPGGDQGGRVQVRDGGGGEAEDVQHTVEVQLEQTTSSTIPTFKSSLSIKPKPMYFKKKRGIIPDRLVQMRLSNFRKTFPNLNTEENAKLSSYSNYTNINVGESGGKVSTNRVRAATLNERDLTIG